MDHLDVDVQSGELGETLLTDEPLQLQVARHDRLVREEVSLQKVFPLTDSELHHAESQQGDVKLRPAGLLAAVPNAV